MRAKGVAFFVPEPLGLLIGEPAALTQTKTL
jgi:hypothetical protein